jgi:hypothetical protein
VIRKKKYSMAKFIEKKTVAIVQNGVERMMVQLQQAETRLWLKVAYILMLESF